MNRIILILLSFVPFLMIAQNGEIHGNFDLNIQSYQEDNAIGAERADEIMLSNSYFNVLYSNGNFSAGFRYESYLNALLDFDDDYKGNGFPYRYASYNFDGLEVTAGNYYEQFGSGLIFRSYEDKMLGVDNAMDGIRLKYQPYKGIYLKSFIGKSRTYFTYSEGIVRGIDAESDINEIFGFNRSTNIVLGGSFVSRYQKDQNPVFNLPENVGAYSSRINISSGKINYYAEYAYKINDPENSLVENNYATGNAFMSSLSYSKKGMGISLETHRVDHFEFRSERQRSKEYIMNYIPTLSKQHTYTLAALYPCATQAEGEFGYQVDIFYNIKKGNFLGGKYGTKINLNYSKVIGLEGGFSRLNDNEDFSPPFMGDSDNLYFSDFNIEIYKKITKKIKLASLLSFQSYNKDIMEGKTIGEYGVVNSKIGILDVTYKLKSKHTLRVEIQGLLADGGEGDWSMGLIEYTISPNWFFTLQDMYNWGNSDPEKQLHYVNINMGFLKGSTRFSIGYGKKRAGIFCVGGICKEVPSSNGFSFNISSSF